MSRLRHSSLTGLSQNSSDPCLLADNGMGEGGREEWILEGVGLGRHRHPREEPKERVSSQSPSLSSVLRRLTLSEFTCRVRLYTKDSRQLPLWLGNSRQVLGTHSLVHGRSSGPGGTAEPSWGRPAGNVQTLVVTYWAPSFRDAPHIVLSP